MLAVRLEMCKKNLRPLSLRHKLLGIDSNAILLGDTLHIDSTVEEVSILRTGNPFDTTIRSEFSLREI